MDKNLKELELEIILKKYDEVLNDNRNLSYFLEQYRLENNDLKKNIEILKEVYPIKINEVSNSDILLPYGELEKLCKKYKAIIDKAIKYYESNQQECVIGRNKDEKLIKEYYLPAQCSKKMLDILKEVE